MSLKQVVRRLTPQPLLSCYHLSLACLAAIAYRFPSRKLVVIGVTGTDGKTSTTEFINAIFEEAGKRTALSNSIRVKVGTRSLPGTGRSMPGRFFAQRFLRNALNAGCDIAILEMTSEGARQHRHRCIELDCLVFTNLSPEHIESHGSLQAYANAKFELGRALARSLKRPRIMVANKDDAESARYLALSVEKRIGFSLKGVQWESTERGGHFSYGGVDIAVALAGKFYVLNALAAAEVAHAFGVTADAIKKGIEKVRTIPGRGERIECGQAFGVIVDYALTPEALEGLYKTYGDKKKVCVFGSAGGGRDKWKRPLLGKLAEQYCEHVILTNDIAYGENAQGIIDDIASGMRKRPEMMQDRRLAISRALEIALSWSKGASLDKARDNQNGVVVLITGMGADTEITSADGMTVRDWNDAKVVREELERVKTI
jgi:UDP-N-acetylmuramoyl-L-alanyl-D-glutamate--2,6-diaminopimelate ligase